VASDPVRIQESIKFGDDCELDTVSYELRRLGRVLKLERIPAEILLFLVEQRGKLVTREQIVDKIWGKGVFLDTDNSINGAMRKIRQALQDDPERPRFIQTITGRGYRFIAPAVAPVPAPPSVPVVKTVADQPEPTAVASFPQSGHRRWRILLGLAVSLIAVVGAWFLRSSSLARFRPASGRLMLAVLPFENLTGDASQDYFSDGMTEEMITELGGLNPEHLGVIARTSVMFYKHNPKPLEQVGRELGVQYVLEGSVRRSADQVRVTGQLIRVQDQTHLWARQYDRELKDLLKLQSEIAGEISQEIQTALGNHSAITPLSHPLLSPQELEAHDLYLKGQYFWNKRTADGFERSIKYFEQAIAKNSGYARAYAGLADSYALIGGYTGIQRPEFAANAKTAALRALQLDPSLPEAHTARALVVENYDLDWQTAEREYRRAIALNPSYATAHHWYAEYLTWRGRFDEALSESERARQLDPLSLIIAADYGAILYYSRHYDRAIEQFLRVRDMDPNFSRAAIIVGVYVEKGMLKEALALIQGPPVDAPWHWSLIAYVYGRAGRQAEARHALARLLQLNRREPVDAAAIVRAYISVGDKEHAFDWLEKAYSQQSIALTALRVDPVYDPLRSDPRFQELLLRVGLAE
jgi:TolB-like protein/DNA-binding winged helix-turn-helix (wHTH) protein/Flp pilus assembly protein TadD